MNNTLDILYLDLSTEDFKMELLRRLSNLEYSSRGLVKNCECWRGLIRKLGLQNVSDYNLLLIQEIISPYLKFYISGEVRKRLSFIGNRFIARNQNYSSIQKKLFGVDEIE